jgi:hypothetical protein
MLDNELPGLMRSLPKVNFEAYAYDVAIIVINIIKT